jgi:hypothetical protein
MMRSYSETNFSEGLDDLSGGFAPFNGVAREKIAWHLVTWTLVPLAVSLSPQDRGITKTG